MKKIVGIVLVVIVLAAAFYAYQNFGLPKVESLESITPQEVIYYIYSYNPDKKIKDFQANAFFKQVTDNALFKEFIQPQLDKLQKQVPFLPDFLQQDVALGVYSLAKEPVGEMLILSRIDPKKNIKLKKTLADYYLSVGNKTEVKHSSYRGIKISEYKLPYKDLTISCAFLSDVVLIANSQGIIKKSIDIYREKSHKSAAGLKNLLNNKNFQKLSSKIKKDALFWVFADNQYYYQEVLRTYSYDTLKSRSLEAGKSIDPLLKMKPFMDMMNIFEGYVSYVDYDQQREGFVTKIYQSFNKSGGDQDFLNVIAYDKALDKDISKLVLEDAIIYYGGSQDLVNGWKLIRKFALSMDEIMRAQVLSDPKYAQYKDQANMMSFDNAISMVQAFLGINIETDIFPVLGNNFGVIFAGFKDVDIEITPPAGKNQLPQQPVDKKNVTIMFPEVYSFIELKDNTKMQKTMEEITQRLVDNINQLTQPPEQEKAKEQAQPQEKPQEPASAEGTAGQQPQAAANPEPMQAKPQEAPKLLDIKSEDYNGITLKSIEISNPQAAFLKPTYCILDKYIVFSLSQDVTKKVIDMYIAKAASFANNPDFQAVKDKVLPDYSNLLFFNFGALIANIRGTRTFADLESSISRIPQVKLSKENLDSILDILGNIGTFIFTNRVTEPDIIETDCYLKVKGL